MDRKTKTFYFPGGSRANEAVYREMAKYVSCQWELGWETVEEYSGHSMYGPFEIRLILAPTRDILRTAIRAAEGRLSRLRKELENAPEPFYGD